MTRIEEHERDAVIRAIVAAITDEGSHPEYHRAVSKLCREEWPTLFAALDRLVTLETRGDKPWER